MRYVAFLRAINVGGHTVAMERLRAHFDALGFAHVETFIASGNVIFETRSKDAGALEKKIEAHLQKSLGYEVKTFLRSDADLARIAASQPFPPGNVKAARTLLVGFMEAPLSAGAAKVWLALKTKEDDFHTKDREVYWLCKDGQGQSKYFNVSFEKMLETRLTFRSMTTVAKLAAKYPPPTTA
ncbi:MAG: DUF1697 domain-containing protein [Vicinamibacterales bacterium]